jgi:hypothetical protein
MWKITTRGFTLEEVFLADMNLLTNADTAAKCENRASQKSHGDQALSTNTHFLIALHSPNTLPETGLRSCPPEKSGNKVPFAAE